ncbi:hypothetical protein [Rubrivivax gelatinosus]|uniref:hypothetical protein n=1 Tax=Rubrivivax gelatinosus TaxID=28068 RepID=UPI0011D28E2A|nr:hypothetical protein [Rubrivivax gelatinosus]
MKKKIIPFNGSESSYGRDYKLEHTERESKRNIESTDIWLYLGADVVDKNFAKIGITMGDLASRSYSSSRPTYYLFCAFKFKCNVSAQEVKRVEVDVLSRIDGLHRNKDGSSKRMVHCESGVPSECFYPVEFFAFFKDLHDEIYDHHRGSFVISGYENECGVEDGEFVDCIFSPLQERRHNEYRKMILRYD